MAVYVVENQWGGNSAPWHPGGNWILGDRPNQNPVSINIVSNDKGETFEGEMTYLGEGPIGFRAVRTDGSYYRVENQWGETSAPWNPGGTWLIGTRYPQLVVSLNVNSNDGGVEFIGQNTYNGEGPIGFRSHIDDSE